MSKGAGKKLSGKKSSRKNASRNKRAADKQKPAKEIKAVRIERGEHGISRKDIDEHALKVLYRLRKAGYHACLVGGAVRDLALGAHPKDFDVATDATPEQVNELFRNCRLIGRRFRLAHIHFGRQIIEVATYRADHDETLDGHLDDSGRILRDNVYGGIGEDVWRRDFTVNALYYDIDDFSVIDFVDGWRDLHERKLRVIGDTETRFREDPVRMIRAIRFAAKLQFTIDDEITQAIHQLGSLLQDIPAARLYEETLKLFHSGHAVESFQQLREYNLLQYLFPQTAAVIAADDTAIKFIELALHSTDSRIRNGSPVTPAFLFAAMLWAPLQQAIARDVDNGMPYAAAMQKSISAVIGKQVGSLSIPRRFSTVMRDIWALQGRFRYRKGRRMQAVLAHPKFRAAYDFLVLRGEAGENVNEDADWWTQKQKESPPPQHNHEHTRTRRSNRDGQSRRRRPPRKPDR
jgi:poly(A) polymerase